MTGAIQHLRRNVVAYIALFVALGGTSYAAWSLPRASVGARQIKNHVIEPVKFGLALLRKTKYIALRIGN